MALQLVTLALMSDWQWVRGSVKYRIYLHILQRDCNNQCPIE